MKFQVTLDDGRTEMVDIATPMMIYTPPTLYLRGVWSTFTDAEIADIRERVGGDAADAAEKLNTFMRENP